MAIVNQNQNGHAAPDGRGQIYLNTDRVQENEVDRPVAINTSVDLYGAILRRKFIIILFGLIGTLIAYLVYSKTPPVYSSSLRLMIWVQNPPSVENSDYNFQTPPITKHQGLLSSQLVMNNAFKDGQLAKLATFSSSEFPLGILMRMVSVVPAEDAADALDLSCNGPIAEDLPIALEKVVAAYTAIIEEDSVAAGNESSRLMELLHQRLLENQNVAQLRYEELLKKLNLSAENERGQWINPFVDELVSMKKEKELNQKALREIERSISQVKEALDATTNREELVQLVDIEARKYLQLNADKIRELDPEVAENLSIAARKKSLIETMELELIGLESDRLRLLKTVGAKHSSVLSAESSIESLTSQLQRVRADLNRLLLSRRDSISSNSTSDSDPDQWVKDEQLATVKLYATALLRDRRSSQDELKQTDERIKVLETEAALIASDMVELNVLKDQIEERRLSVKQLFEKLSAVNVVANNFTTTKVRVINSPGIGYRIAPNPIQYLSVGAIAMSLLGVALAVLIDHSDLIYRTPIDIQEKLKVPVLCRIPNIKRAKPEPNFIGSPMIVVHCKPQSVASEAFRAARTSLLFAANRISGKVFLFTSPSPGDGKSTMTANLAVSLAEAGKKVLLIDADFRRPRVHAFFGMQIGPGLVDIINNNETIDSSIRDSFQENLSILSAGGRPKNPGEIVSSNVFAEIIAEVRNQFDIILIDSPPILPVADATSLARLADGVLLVLRIRRGVAVASRKAKDQLDFVQARMTGVIVNGVDENPYYNEYGYYAGYGTSYGGNYNRYYDAQNVIYADRITKENGDDEKI